MPCSPHTGRSGISLDNDTTFSTSKQSTCNWSAGSLFFKGINRIGYINITENIILKFCRLSGWSITSNKNEFILWHPFPGLCCSWLHLFVSGFFCLSFVLTEWNAARSSWDPLTAHLLCEVLSKHDYCICLYVSRKYHSINFSVHMAAVSVFCKITNKQ